MAVAVVPQGVLWFVALLRLVCVCVGGVGVGGCGWVLFGLGFGGVALCVVSGLGESPG